MPICLSVFFVWFSFSQQILQIVSRRRRIAAFMRHPGAQWGRPPSTEDCSLHSRWLQNAFHELSETLPVLNVLLSPWGAVCSSVSALLPCQQFSVERSCHWSLRVGCLTGLLLLIFYRLQEGWIWTIAIILNQVGIILGTPLQHLWKIKPGTLGRPVSLCWNSYASYFSEPWLVS